ncbi:ABC transporter permease [Solibacillus merdavium]|uniref:ABC transporter permease n=1 Tax=Solibacillus merdavium TaxID=2762218 RepID=A0ABR8XIP4_9BACL|nr:ABC transporter permease [Solibacillus merdavium]MBD8031818.1 ABC transporter permease [Solibacillus merdavium]
MSFLEVLYFIVPSALLYATPLILTGIGALFSERAGVIGLGVEGLMIVGAFTGIYINLEYYADFGKNVIWLALLAALLAGAVFSLIIAVAAVTFRADQTVTGVAVNMLAAAITVFLVKLIYGKGQTDMVSAPLQRFEIPYLSDIPFLGPLLFQNVYSTTIIALIVAVGAWFVLYKMPFGLRIRSVGEHPMAADTMGINVAKMRYIGVMISGALAGVGGASLAMTSSGDFSGSTVAGQGFIAIAAMIFGKWHPLGTLGAALFFGLAQTLSIGGGNIPFVQDIPSVILQVLPYVLTILALAGFIGKAVAPKASGVPYIKGKR